MTSFDDRLRDLFTTSGPDPADLQGDVGRVHATVRQWRLRRRTAVGAVAAAVVAGGILLLTPGGNSADVIMPVAPAEEPSTAPTTGRTETTTGRTETTSGSTPASSTSSTTSSSAPPVPSIRDVALGEASYTDTCPTFADDRTADLQGGTVQLPYSDGVDLYVDLGPVGYADADGDGDEDAVLVLRCTFAGASTDHSAQLRTYGATATGGIEQIGASQVVEHDWDASIRGLTVTIDLDKYSPDDAMCCPSAGAREVWRFDGSRFQLIQSTPIDPPGAGG